MGGQIGLPALSVYHATKWGIEGFAGTTKSVRSTDISRADTRIHRICNVSAIVAALSNHAGLGARSHKPGYQWDHFIDGKVSLPTFGRYLSSFDPVRAQQRRRWPLVRRGYRTAVRATASAAAGWRARQPIELKYADAQYHARSLGLRTWIAGSAVTNRASGVLSGILVHRTFSNPRRKRRLPYAKRCANNDWEL